MGKLTTHVLDTSRGKPGQGIAVTLYRLQGEQRTLLTQTLTNDDGRCDEPLLSGDDLVAGVYELVFDVGSYFEAFESTVSHSNDTVRFLGDVVLRFGVASPEQHYHVPLVVTPYSYSTYRGS